MTFKPYWLAIGSLPEGGHKLYHTNTAVGATREGRYRVARGEWAAFRVAKVTAAYYRGAVRQ
jgi:hypothetical protein